MSLTTEIWTRNAFDVEAVRITEENIGEVAAWCGGRIFKTMSDHKKRYVHVVTFHYNRRKESKAFVGDWLLFVDGEFKHYRDESFRKSHTSKDDLQMELVDILHEVKGTTRYTLDPFGETLLLADFAKRILNLFQKG